MQQYVLHCPAINDCVKLSIEVQSTMLDFNKTALTNVPSCTNLTSLEMRQLVDLETFANASYVATVAFAALGAGPNLLFLVVAIVGLAGKQLSYRLHAFLLNISIADMLCSVFISALVVYVQINSTHGNADHNVTAIILEHTVLFSLLLATLTYLQFTLLKLTAIVAPFWHHKHVTKSLVMKTLLLSWPLALLATTIIALPKILVLQMKNRQSVAACRLKFKSIYGFCSQIVLMGCYLSLLTAIVAFVCTAKKLQRTG